MNDKITTIQMLKEKVSQFINERDWRQFHGAKNLSMDITIEAAELMEIFTWARDQKEAETILKQKREHVEQELADIVFAALAFCNEYDIDLSSAMEQKIMINAAKYPIDKSKGNNKKYTEL